MAVGVPAIVREPSMVTSVRYTDEGPRQIRTPALYRGVEMPVERGWIRAEAPPVEYTFQPLAPTPVAEPTRRVRNQTKRADVRMRRALQDAWCDPARARSDLLAAGTAYAELGDSQGLAMAFAAHAQTRLGDANLAGWKAHLSLNAAGLAREEYSHAHAIFSSLLNTQPVSYKVARHQPYERACIAQRMRPAPLHMTAEDACAASMGGGF